MVHPDETAQWIEDELEKDKADKERRERAEKYPMCTKLEAESKKRRTLLDFLDWLQSEKDYRFGTWSDGDFVRVHTHDEKLVHEYMGIDDDALEKERRAILEEARRANGDKAPEGE